MNALTVGLLRSPPATSSSARGANDSTARMMAAMALWSVRLGSGGLPGWMCHIPTNRTAPLLDRSSLRASAGRAADKPVLAGLAVGGRAGGHRDPHDAGGVVALTKQQPTGLRSRLRRGDARADGGVGVGADPYLLALALVDEHAVGVPGEVHGRPVTAVQADVG
ncbi:MAG TPA: hypothetical protein VFA46_24485 [Actinomycetes bacterium]|jgi:hypothetical protein|nr:hypothetical protein [Actinomycetes bacterium]